MSLRPVGVALLLGATACAGATASRGAARRDAVVLVRSNVAEASLFVDGRFLAPVGLIKGGVALSPGPHRLELRHPDYLGRFLEVELAPAERRVVDAELFPIPP